MQQRAQVTIFERRSVASTMMPPSTKIGIVLTHRVIPLNMADQKFLCISNALFLLGDNQFLLQFKSCQ